jgi:serine/threonine protein kinase
VRASGGGGGVASAPGGDPEFQAPEIARDEKHGAPCDVWSLGCLVHLLVAGTPPLHDSNTARLRQKIGKGGAAPGGDAWPKTASAGALACVKALLVADVKTRPTAAAAVAHAWFSEKTDAPLNTFKATLSAWNNDR